MMQDMKDEMASKLEATRIELNRAQEEADAANLRVEELERQSRALQSALDILEGRTPAPAPATPFFPNPPVDSARDFRNVLVMPPAAPSIPGKKVTLNGEEIILEPGFRVGKNSFGEDVLLPEGVPDPTPMAEPFVPQQGSVSLPPITSEDRFDDPKDML